MTNAQQTLAEFVVSKAFNPVMRAKPDGRSEADRRHLHLPTIEDVKEEFEQKAAQLGVKSSA